MAEGGERDGAAPQALISSLVPGGLDELERFAGVQGLDQRLVQLQVLIHADAPLVAGAVAIGAAAPAPELQAVGFRAQLGLQHAAQRGVQLKRLRAAFTHTPHQALRQDTAQAGRDQVRRGAHVHEARQRRGRVIGMQGGQHHVAGHGGAQRDLHGLRIADLADQNDVRILAQGRAQHPAEGQFDLGVDLNLINAPQAILDRVLDGKNLERRLVEFLERAVQRGGLAAAGRAGHQHHAVRAVHQPPEALEHFLGHAQLIHVQDAGRLIQQAHHHRFAVLHRHGGQTHVDGLATHPHRQAPVLRQAPLGDIETGHEFEARHQGAGDAPLGGGLHAQHAVETETDAQLIFIRLDVDIRGVDLHGVFEHGLEQLDHRRVGQALGLRQLADVVGRHLLIEFGGEAADLGGAAIEHIDRLQQVRLFHHRQPQRPAQHPRQFIVGKNIGGIGHADQQPLAAVLERQHPEAARVHLGDEAHDLGFQVITFEIDVRDIELAREKHDQLVVGEIAVLDQHPTELAAALFLVGERGVELFLGDDFVLDEQIADADFLRFDSRHGHADTLDGRRPCRVLVDVLPQSVDEESTTATARAAPGVWLGWGPAPPNNLS